MGGFAGPYAIGLIKGATGQAKAGLLFLSVLLLVAFVMTWLIRLHAPQALLPAKHAENA